MCAAGIIRGEVLVNGHPWQSTTYARLSGYVEQSDIHSAKVGPRSGTLKLLAGIQQASAEAFAPAGMTSTLVRDVWKHQNASLRWGS